MNPQFHLERDRAESFGAQADDYERFRPDFPPALLDELAALGRDVLDIGTGTGKVARGLAARGCTVLGVEIDARMAEVARGHGITVEIARFEDWDARGRTFALVTCGDAWHWIDPARGTDAVARVLAPGGRFVHFWNLQMLDEDVMRALDPIYAELAPEVHRYGRMPELPHFPGDVRRYQWERHVTANEWLGFARTISDHRRLGPRLAPLVAAMRQVLPDHLQVRGLTTATFE